MKKLIFLTTLISCTTIMNGKNDYEKELFTPGTINSIKIEMPDSTWQTFIANASRKQYIVCNVVINGERLDSVGIRTKGASSLDDVRGMKLDRYSFTLKLNEYRKGQKYHGLTKLCLNNNIWDATQMKDAIVYDMAHYLGLAAPLTNYAQITVNDHLHGYYLAVEPVDKDFCKRNYPEEKSSIYKPYYNLDYRDDNIKSYGMISNDTKYGGGEESMQNVVAALKSVAQGQDIESHVDIESVLKYMALQTMVVNYDCMTGNNTQNYYLHEGNGKISLIPWDYNLAWGGYPEDDFSMFGGGFGGGGDWGGFGGSGGGNWGGFGGGWGGFEISRPGEDLGQSTPQEVSRIVNFPINTPFSADLNQRKFFMNLLANDKYLKQYHHYLEMLCKEYIKGGKLAGSIALIMKEIGQTTGTESNAFYTNAQFHTATQTLEQMLDRKATSVLGQIAGTIPSTWDDQKAAPEKLLDCSDINLRLLGGLGY